MDDWSRWQARLAQLARRHRVPGATLAVLADSAVHEAATGVVNVETGVETTTDSVFQIGSITKVYTTTLIMQLVESGTIDLDEPVVTVLDELRLGDPDAAARITTRHLLTHTSGIEGDHFVDTGRGDDALAQYVQTCARLPLNHPVGATMSYCNTGFVIAGRMVERLTGSSWHEALRDRVLDPLNLRHTTGLAEEAIRFRAAFGHEVDGDTPPKLVSTWQLPPSGAPAGATLCSSAADLIKFAEMHLNGGGDVLSAASAAAMREPRVAVPNPWILGTHWGLGWIVSTWDGRRVVGHDGATLGQSSFLWLVPDAGVAVALLTNGGNTKDLYRELCGELLAELCDVRMPEPLVPPAEPVRVDLARYTGTYERVGNRIELSESNGTLAARIIITGELAELVGNAVVETTFIPVAEDLFVTKQGDERTWTPVVFYALPNGSRYLHMGVRATPRVAPAPLGGGWDRGQLSRPNANFG